MDSQLIGWIGMTSLGLLLVMRVPVAFAMALVGFLGYWGVSGTVPALKMAGLVPYSSIATYGFSVIPLFLIMGSFLTHAGLVADLFGMAKKWVGNIPGGLVHATIVAGSAFGAASGSGLASTMVLSSVCIPEMRKGGVDKILACGTVASVGPIAQMIPPSILMVIYCIITGASLGKLLIAGILPGLLLTVSFMVLTYLRVKRNPGLAPLLTERVSWGDRFKSLINVWGILLIASLVLGGIYSGAFTPTEAGAVGAFCSFLLAVMMRRAKYSDMLVALLHAAKISAQIFLIIMGAFMFGYFLTITRIPSVVSEFVTSLPLSRIFILLAVMVMYLIIGTFIDMIAALFITMPIIYPTMVTLGFDPIWFGVLIVMTCEIALITPPFGISLFIVKGVVKDVTFMEVVKGIVPFLVVDIIVLGLYILFPQIALFLPQQMMGK